MFVSLSKYMSMPKSGVCVCVQFIRYCQMLFMKDCTNLYSCQCWEKKGDESLKHGA